MVQSVFRGYAVTRPAVWRVPSCRDLPGLGFARRRDQLGHRLDLHVAVLQLPLVVLFQRHRTIRRWSNTSGEDADNVGATLHFLVQPFQRVQLLWILVRCCSGKSRCDRTSVSLSSMNAASFGHFCRSWSAT